MTNGPPERRTDLRTFVACVPLGFEAFRATFGRGLRKPSVLVTGVDGARRHARSALREVLAAPMMERALLASVSIESGQTAWLRSAGSTTNQDLDAGWLKTPLYAAGSTRFEAARSTSWPTSLFARR
jgi:hypothetical protein